MRNSRLKPFSSYIQSWTPKEPTLERERPPGIASLPYEVIIVVIEYLEEREQAHMIQTCRYYRNIVEPVLYRHVKITWTPDKYRHAMLKTYLLHNTLVGRPDLLPGILRYSGPVTPNVSELEQALAAARRMETVWVRLRHVMWPFKICPSHDQCFQKAKKIFSGMVNIQDLKFTDEVGQWLPELWDTFATARSNRNIERLELRVQGDYPFLISILRAQPRLKHLDIGRSAGTRVQDLQSTDLQELQSLVATLSEAAIFVPGRPIKKLELLHYEVGPFFLDQEPNPVEARFKNLERSKCDITDFTLRFQRTWDDNVSERNLRFAIRYLPRIERLSLVVHGMLSEDMLLKTMPAFGSLQQLVLIGDLTRKQKVSPPIGRDYYHDVLCGPQDFADFAQRLKACCFRLTEVEQRENPWKIGVV